MLQYRWFHKPTIERGTALADQYPELYLTLGWNSLSGDYSLEVEESLTAKHPKVVALGGLD